jgi:hypothetical protein
LPNPIVLDFQVTVSGATGGNGTFGLADFTQISWCTNGATLDLGAELVGQPTPGDPWGTPGGDGGDFNLFGAAPRPNGVEFFTLCANGGEDPDCMILRSMRIRPDPITFDFLFEDLQGSARALGFVTFDRNLLPNPAACDDSDGTPQNPVPLALKVTVSGAAGGNGTFDLSDFQYLAWCTNGATLDLDSQLVGQPTPGEPWGTPSEGGAGGDFNLFFGAAPRPNGEFWFTLCADGGQGDCMTLTSMMAGPATPIAFDFAFEGLDGSAAHAEGAIAFREDLLPNPQTCEGSAARLPLPNPAVSDLRLMVSGAAGGNGTFGLTDFHEIAWCTNGATLDLNAELVGQPTPEDPWGTLSEGGGGDFNLFGTPPRPTGVIHFTLCTNADGPILAAAAYGGGGAGGIGGDDCMGLTSMTIRPEFQCAGNCGGDGAVTVDELVFGANILNGRVLPGRCRALSPDGAGITIDRVLAAVTNGLQGCAR